uniref:Uroplakin-1a n=1 Tax=Oryctolagus cuniculus TaxID=9986 RepID=A0A5F9CND2_RABIT
MALAGPSLPSWPLPQPQPCCVPTLQRGQGRLRVGKGLARGDPRSREPAPCPAALCVQLSGLALFAETVWVTADQYRVYPLMGVSGKDDVFAGAWIAIFCGFSFFVVASFGVGAALCRSRSMILTYLVLMLIVYIFECASCITSYTHRDYVSRAEQGRGGGRGPGVGAAGAGGGARSTFGLCWPLQMVSNPSLITKQMLTFYSADTDQGRELTRLWDRIMIEQECCGTSGPMDWVNYTSAFRAATPELVFPWPPLCCRRTGNFIPVNEEGCRLGHVDYLFIKVRPLPPLHLHLSAHLAVLLQSQLALCFFLLCHPAPSFSLSPLSPLSLSALPLQLSLQTSEMLTGSVWPLPGTCSFSQVIWEYEKTELTAAQPITSAIQ